MEKITTVRLEINGEPAKNTLDELRQRAEVLSQKISAIKIPAQSGGNERLMSNVYGLTETPQSQATAPLSEQGSNISAQSAELRRLEREYAAVTAEIERLEASLLGVASVMNRLAKEQEEKEGFGFWGNMFR